jgi:ABC-type phosphate/phosphonate transport system substrate-binding protein
MRLVANARMYAVTPRAGAAWRELFAWVAKTSGIALTYLDHAAPAPLEALWTRSDLGLAFMCGLPFASAAPQPHLVAAPVPSAARYRNTPCYCTDLVVRADRPLARLSDAFGGRIGWTVEHSQSGYSAPRHHLLRHYRDRAEPLFAHWIGPLVTPRRVIEAVLDGKIDVGPLDSYVHDLLGRHEAETAARLRVIESTTMTPNPPLVASAAVAGETVERLRRALLSCAAEPAMAPVLDALCIARFAAVDPADYADLPRRADQADASLPPVT